MSGFLGALASVYVAPPPAGTPTAPAVKQHNGNFGNGGARTTTTLSSVVTGDLILVWANIYANSATPVAPAVSDSAAGTFADSSNTYTPALGTALNVQPDSATAGDYYTGNAWLAVAQANAATLTIGVGNGDYRSIIAVNLGQDYDAAIYDDGGTRKSMAVAYTNSGSLATIDNATTTYSHDFVLGGFFWYESAATAAGDATWPLIRAAGDSSNNNFALVGKAVSATGDYDPYVTISGMATYAGGISYVIKGKNL